METRIVYLVRHGEIRRDDDLPRYLGQLDVPLSEEGRRQARALGRRLRGASLGGIYCSDLARSLETAELARPVSAAPLVARSDLREVSLGEWEGCSFRDIAARFPEQYRARGRDLGGYRPPGGESFVDCSQRVVAAFHQVMNASSGDLLVVGHAGVNRLLLCHLLGMLPANLFRLGQDYACSNVVRCEGSTYQVKVVNGCPADLGRELREARRRRPGGGRRTAPAPERHPKETVA
jgi:broad specificity phosphatase PhoE